MFATVTEFRDHGPGDHHCGCRRWSFYYIMDTSHYDFIQVTILLLNLLEFEATLTNV
jgi:hypothetical protein